MSEKEKEFDDLLNRLCAVLASIEDDEERISLAFYALLEVAYQSASTHFELLGLLREAEYTLREQSLEDMEWESDKEPPPWYGKLSGDN
jgi:hypothetical protein